MDTDMKIIGARIRAARKARGLRQEDVALASGVGVRFVHDLERGKPSVEMDRVLRVVEAVGLEIHFDERPGP